MSRYEVTITGLAEGPCTIEMDAFVLIGARTGQRQIGLKSGNIDGDPMSREQMAGIWIAFGKHAEILPTEPAPKEHKPGGRR